MTGYISGIIAVLLQHILVGVLAASLGPLAAFTPRDQGNSEERSQLTLVRAYEAFRHHDPQHLDKTAAALAESGAVCGATTPLFDLLRLETPRKTALALVSQLDEARIPEVIGQAFARAAAALPGTPITVCVYLVELTKGIPYLAGVGGTSMGAGRIHIYLHPTADRFAKLPYTVAHEYYHEVERIKAPPLTPDDVLVSEGKADYFATQLYPQVRPPHTVPGTGELRVAWQAFARYRRMDRAAFRSAFMIAAPPSELPLWAGYKLGFEVAKQYLSAMRGNPETWATIPSAEMIARFRVPTP